MADGQEGAAAVLSGEPAAGNGGQPGNGAGGEPQHWADTIADEGVRGWLKTKGYETPEAAYRSHWQLEKLRGVPEDRLLTLPKDTEDAEGWGKVWERLGRPESPDGYKLPVPEGGDATFAKAASAAFHEAGISKDQAAKLAEWWGGYQEGLVKQYEERSATEATEAMTALKGKLGATYDQFAAVVDRTAATFNMTEDQLLGLKAAMGPAAAMEFLHNIGARLGEDAFVTGNDPESFALTPESAKAKRAELLKDKDFMERWNKGDAKARREWSQINQTIAAGNVQTPGSAHGMGAPQVPRREHA